MDGETATGESVGVSGVAARQLDQGEISKRAYFIHLEEGGSDQLGNWLRAERELMTA